MTIEATVLTEIFYMNGAGFDLNSTGAELNFYQQYPKWQVSLFILPLNSSS